MSELPKCKSDLGTVWSSWLTVEFQRSTPLKYYKKSQSFREKTFMKNYYILCQNAYRIYPSSE